VNSQLPLSIKLRDVSVFGSFLAGPNQAIVDVLRSLEPGSLPPTVFLQGSVASGKTHLLQATCAQAPQRGFTAGYVPLRELGLIGPDVLSGWGDLDIVCIDDIEVVANSRPWNLALFALHQHLEERRARLVVASRLAPAALQLTLPDLASRLAGGLILTVQPLAESEQVQALQLRAKLRGFDLPDETAAYMLRRLPRDMATLYRRLDELDHAALVAQRRLTIPFVRTVIDKV
jgi:DnaA-homolog protein